MAETQDDRRGSAGRTPAPPPRQRVQPLPWQEARDWSNDQAVEENLRAIYASGSYRQADEDPEFLRRPELRGVRLQLDYLKPELVLAEHGIVHTIVVFGSTRIKEPDEARRHVEALEAAVAQHPDDAAALDRLEVARRLEAKSHFYTVARDFGRLVGRAGAGSGGAAVTLVTGGGPGIMEAANRGAFDVGAKTVGLNITLPHEQYPNPFLTPDLSFRFHYFAMRKLHFMLRARALVAFPGGYGTLDELFETLTLIQTRKVEPVPIVLVGEAYWRRVFDVDYLVTEGTIDPEDRDLYWYAETPEEIWRCILDWHAANGTPLLEGTAPA